MDKKGFTLTEILIVLIVAGILLGLILPNTFKAIERGNLTAHKSNLNTIQVALLMCFTEERDWSKCGDFAQLTDGHYLDSVPPHPFQGTYTIEDDPNGTGGKMACSENSTDFPESAVEDNCG